MSRPGASGFLYVVYIYTITGKKGEICPCSFNPLKKNISDQPRIQDRNKHNFLHALI